MSKFNKNTIPNKHQSLNPQQRMAALNLDIQKLQGAVNNVIGQVNSEMGKLRTSVQNNLNNINIDLGNTLDWIEAIIQVGKSTRFTQERFFKYCHDTLKMPYTEMDTEIKLNAIMQYVEMISNVPDSVYFQHVYTAFDRRNNLVALPENELPTEGDIAFMTWKFEVDGVPITGQTKLSVYKLGSKELVVDDEILQMKPGETKEFQVTFPQEHKSDLLKGKSGKMTIGLARFKRQVLNQRQIAEQVQKLPIEKKQKIWKEHYKPETIE
jgi:hypothetical protein